MLTYLLVCDFNWNVEQLHQWQRQCPCLLPRQCCRTICSMGLHGDLCYVMLASCRLVGWNIRFICTASWSFWAGEFMDLILGRLFVGKAIIIGSCN